MTVRAKDPDGQPRIEFNIAFDVVDGDIPFLIGLSTSKAMKCNVNFKHLNLSLRFDNEYHRLGLVEDDGHIHLPFLCEEFTPVKRAQNAG